MKRIGLWGSLVLAPALIGASGCATCLSHLPERLGSKDISSELGIARCQEQQGQVGKAKEMYRDILKRNQNVVEAHQRLAVMAARQGDFAVAETHFEAARQLQPNNATLLSDIAYAQYAAGQLERAERTARAALAIEPNHKRAQNNLGLILGRQGRFDESYLAFRKATSESDAHANVAYLYSQSGSIDKAKPHDSRTLTLDDKNRQATPALRQLHDLEQTLVAADEAAKESPASPESHEQAAAQATYEVVSQHPQPLARGESPSETTISRSIPESAPQPAVTGPQASSDADADANPLAAEESVSSLVSRCPAAEGAVRSAVERLDAGTPAQQKSALRQLEKLGGAAKAAAPACREMLKNADHDICATAAVALWKIEGDAAAGLPGLSAGLASRDANLREVCAWTLGEMRAAAESAVPALTQACSHTDPHVGLLAAEAITKIQPTNREATNTLIRALNHDDSQVKLLAAYAVAGIAPQDKACVFNLSQCLKDGDHRVRAAAAFALGQIGPAASSAVPALEACREDAHELVRSNAELARSRIHGSEASDSEAH